jgi:hypothetical protein
MGSGRGGVGLEGKRGMKLGWERGERLRWEWTVLGLNAGVGVTREIERENRGV